MEFCIGEKGMVPILGQMSKACPERPRILLVAPNISRLMGGEAIKALQIFETYRDLGYDVTQVAHARVRNEMRDYRPELEIVYVEDGPVQVMLYRMGLKWILDVVGAWLLHRKAQQMIDRCPPALVHVTSPISPSVPNFPLKGAPVVIGPLNGNLLHPDGLSHRESTAKRVGSRLLRSVQLVNRFFFRGRVGAALFISGGERTVRALALGGCTRDQMIFTLDSGVSAELRDRPRLRHEGRNTRFVFLGRLVRYKGCDLAIRALARVPDATLDVIGDGQERAALEALARSLGVADRVNFIGYVPGGTELFDRLRPYRAFVFPTLAEANGIVVQEAMMLGLPVIAVNWGGPAELLDPSCGILVEPIDEEHVVRQVSEAMARLIDDPQAADRLAAAAREKAEQEGYDWPSLLHHWADIYDDILARRGGERRFGPWLAARQPEGPASALPLGATS